MHKNRTTAVDGTGALDAPDTQFDPPRVPLRRLLRAMLELARSHRQLRHRPTRAQVRDLARFNGRNPRSYRLDPGELAELPLGLERPVPGAYALCFLAGDGDRQRELVALPGGGGFDRLSGLR